MCIKIQKYLQRDREKDEMKKIEEKEKQLKEETEEAKLSSFEDLVPPEPDSNTPSAYMCNQNTQCHSLSVGIPSQFYGPR